MPRGVFNLLISTLVGVAVVLFFVAASYFEPQQLLNMNQVALTVGSIVVAIAGVYMASRGRNTIVQIIGFLVVPIALGVMSTQWLHSVGEQVLFDAMLMTAAAVALMAILSALFPNFFMRISGILVMALVVIIIVSIIAIFVAGFDYTWLSALSLIVFMGLLGVDFVIARNSPPTLAAAISISVSMFLDVINILLNITALTND